MSKHEQRKTPRDGVVWTPEQRASFRQALIDAQKRTNLRMSIAFFLVIVASVGGSVLSGHKAGESGASAGAKAGRAEVLVAAKKYAYDFQVLTITTQRKACVRGNERTIELNQRVDQHRKTDKAIEIVAAGARDARLRSYEETKKPLDLKAANQYTKALKLLKTIKFKKLPLTNCAKVYAIPPKP